MIPNFLQNRQRPFVHPCHGDQPVAEPLAEPERAATSRCSQCLGAANEYYARRREEAADELDRQEGRLRRLRVAQLQRPNDPAAEEAVEAQQVVVDLAQYYLEVASRDKSVSDVHLSCG